MINHHIPSDILMSYAAGTTTPAVSLVIATHLTLCRKCREEYAKYEELGGYYMQNVEEVKVDSNTINSILDKIDSNASIDDESTEHDKDHFSNIPRVLQKYLPSGKSLTHSWKKTFSGFKYFNINIGDSSSVVKMLSIPPGKKLPHHSHEATEYTLVLEGGFSDEQGRYDFGDIAVVGENHSHTPVADSKEGCVCLVVYEGNLKFKGLLGPVLNYLKI